MKKDGWEIRLADAMTAGLRKTHAWGENDCVTFAADCVKAQTGEDPMGVFREMYHDSLTAAKLIRSLGYKSLGEAVADFLPEILPADARRGDVVLCWSDEGFDFLAVVDRQNAVGPGPTGTVQIPLVQVKRAFKV